jgi:hypothetical protein
MAVFSFPPVSRLAYSSPSRLHRRQEDTSVSARPSLAEGQRLPVDSAAIKWDAGMVTVSWSAKKI